MWAPVGRTRSALPPTVVRGQAEKGQLILLVGFSFRHSDWDLVSDARGYQSQWLCFVTWCS